MFPDVPGKTLGHDDQEGPTMLDKEEGRRRARLAVKTELSRRGWNVQDLTNATGVNRSTLGDFLNGERWPQVRTLSAIEKTLGWAAGTFALILDGEEPLVAVGGDTQDVPEEESALLYRRPEGLSDAEWERVKQESREFIEWQIEKASRER